MQIYKIERKRSHSVLKIMKTDQTSKQSGVWESVTLDQVAKGINGRFNDFLIQFLRDFTSIFSCIDVNAARRCIIPNMRLFYLFPVVTRTLS